MIPAPDTPNSTPETVTISSGTTFTFTTSSYTYYEIDWSKVKTLEDLIIILSLLKITVAKASDDKPGDAYERLTPWLKDEPVKQ